ncbi:DUF998 domain-containing protein [Flindersiella endophytica]
MASSKSVETRSRSPRLLLAAGAVGPPLFILVFLVESATRPDYSAWHMAVSSLSDGPYGWTQITNFVVFGALTICFALGLRRTLRTGKGATWGPILLGTFGLCVIGAGVFVTDPGLGYPPGAVTPATPSVHGVLHGVLSLIGFTSLIAAGFVLARRFAHDPAWRGWSLYSVLTSTGILVFFVLTSVAAASSDPNSPAGLLQRLVIVIGWTWLALLAVQLLRKGAPRPADQS